MELRARRAVLRKDSAAGRSVSQRGLVAQSNSTDAFIAKRRPVPTSESALRPLCFVLDRRILQAVLALGWTGMVGALDVSPDNANWAASIETASVGTTVVFGPGVYRGCNVSIPAGLACACNRCPRACSRPSMSFIADHKRSVQAPLLAPCVWSKMCTLYLFRSQA